MGLSAGNINFALNELQTWRVVHRIKKEGDRKNYYKVEEHIWKSVSNVLKARELKLLNQAVADLKELSSETAADSQHQKQQIKKVATTLETVMRFSEMAVSAPMEKLVKLSTVLSTLRRM